MARPLNNIAITRDDLVAAREKMARAIMCQPMQDPGVWPEVWVVGPAKLRANERGVEILVDFERIDSNKPKA